MRSFTPVVMMRPVPAVVTWTIERTPDNAAFLDAWCRSQQNMVFGLGRARQQWVGAFVVIPEEPEPTLDQDDIRALADVFHLLLSWQGTHALYQGARE